MRLNVFILIKFSILGRSSFFPATQERTISADLDLSTLTGVHLRSNTVIGSPFLMTSSVVVCCPGRLPLLHVSY